MLIEEHNFTWHGEPIKITIEIQPYIHKIEYIKKTLIEELIIKDFHPKYIQEEIECSFVCNRLNPVDRSLESSTLHTFKTRDGEFNKFYFTPTGNAPIGIVIARNLINGVTSEYKALCTRFFNKETLEPFQPISFNTSITTPTISEVTEDVEEEVTEQVPVEITEEVTEQIPVEVSEEVTEDVPVEGHPGETQTITHTVTHIEMQTVTHTVTRTEMQTVTHTVTRTVTNNVQNMDGTITINVVDGVAPFEYKINEDDFVELNTFSGLDYGQYEIIVKDSEGTEFSKTINIEKGI